MVKSLCGELLQSIERDYAMFPQYVVRSLYLDCIGRPLQWPHASCQGKKTVLSYWITQASHTPSSTQPRKTLASLQSYKLLIDLRQKSDKVLLIFLPN